MKDLGRIIIFINLRPIQVLETYPSIKILGIQGSTYVYISHHRPLNGVNIWIYQIKVKLIVKVYSGAPQETRNPVLSVASSEMGKW